MTAGQRKGPAVNMVRAELWASVKFGGDGMLLGDATIDGRPITEDERADLGAAVLVDLQAADVLRQADIAGMNVYVASTEQLLELLVPNPDGLTLDKVLDVVPAGIRDEAAVLIAVMNATAGR